MTCTFCTTDEKYKHLLLKQYKYWRVELGCKQNYLGWTFVILNRHVEDLTELNRNEQNELFSILKSINKTLAQLFKPDKFNYTSLGNITQHLHVQVIPRYKEKRMFAGHMFEDTNWGKNYSPYDKTYTIPQTVEAEIISEFKKHLK
jgi:diadenosine tetraphosphate (Ap4A) HIT family hydrolase